MLVYIENPRDSISNELVLNRTFSIKIRGEGSYSQQPKVLSV